MGSLKLWFRAFLFQAQYAGFAGFWVLLVYIGVGILECAAVNAAAALGFPCEQGVAVCLHGGLVADFDFEQVFLCGNLCFEFFFLCFEFSQFGIGG